MPKIKNAHLARRAVERAEADPSLLTARYLARDASGWPVSTLNPTACRWCLLGLVAVESKVDTRSLEDAILVLVDDSCDEEINQIYEVNDEGIKEKDPLRGVRYLKGLLNAKN